MEFQSCDNYEHTDIIYKYQYISIIISLLIIYRMLISIIIFIKQPIIKEVIKKKLLDTKEKELLTTEEEELLATEEEELIANEEELIANKEKELLDTEEELLLANYNKKQRALALQEAYKEKLNILLKKKNEINIKLDNFNRCGYNLFFNTNNNGLSESEVNKIILLRMIHTNISKSISNEMPSSEEILRIAKKAGVIDSPYDILDLLKIRTNVFDNGHPFYDEYKEVLSKI